MNDELKVRLAKQAVDVAQKAYIDALDRGSSALKSYKDTRDACILEYDNAVKGLVDTDKAKHPVMPSEDEALALRELSKLVEYLDQLSGGHVQLRNDVWGLIRTVEHRLSCIRNK